MLLLIDGYNLLNASGVVVSRRGPATFERSRQALLDFLVDALDERLRRRTTVVFDAKGAPPGLPRVFAYGEMTIRFAPRHAEADALLEELIRADSAPRQLTVVSSDHRIQRAARRRGARPVDSDQWYAEAERQRHARTNTTAESSDRPVEPLPSRELEHWLREFQVDAASSPDKTASGMADRPESEDSLANPFPPGYGEDLREDDLDDG